MEKSPSGQGRPEHYNQLYASGEKVFGGGEPEPLVVESLNFLEPDAKIIEFGAGQGRNSIYLAQQGFEVKATDLSEEGLRQITERSEGLGLDNLSAELLDARQDISGEYDAAVSTFMLHHFRTDEAENFLETIKLHTRPGGLNVLTVFSREGDFYKQNPNAGRFYPEPEGLRAYYKDWSILRYVTRNSRAQQTHPDGSPMFNTAIGLIAQKPITVEK